MTGMLVDEVPEEYVLEKYSKCSIFILVIISSDADSSMLDFITRYKSHCHILLKWRHLTWHNKNVQHTTSHYMKKVHPVVGSTPFETITLTKDENCFGFEYIAHWISIREDNALMLWTA